MKPPNFWHDINRLIKLQLWHNLVLGVGLRIDYVLQVNNYSISSMTDREANVSFSGLRFGYDRNQWDVGTNGAFLINNDSDLTDVRTTRS